MDNWTETELEGRWDACVASYRDSCPEVAPSAQFMPRLWQKIEARNNYRSNLMLLARGFVTAAGCVCLVLSSFLFLPGLNHSNAAPMYIDALADYGAAQSWADNDVTPAAVPQPDQPADPDQ